MFGSEILDVALGMIFLFAALSLFASGFREVLEGLLQTRAVHLERGIRSLLNDNADLTRLLYNHPLVSSLYTGNYPEKLQGRLFKRKDKAKRAPFRSNLPAYIPARNFAAALIDLAGRGEPAEGKTDTVFSLADVRERLDALIPDTKVRRAIGIAIDDAAGDMERARQNVQAWFDSGMDRVSGWYRKETQWILFGVGLIAAVALNVDTIKVATTLYNNEALRGAVVKQAEAAAEVVAKAEGDPTQAILKSWGCEGARADTLQTCTEARIAKLGLPVGWDQPAPFSPSSIPGWLLTALGISLGAPFWFDMLNKMMVIRSTVKPHEKSPEEASEDRQAKPTAPAAAPPPATGPADPPAAPPQATPPPATPPGEPNRIEADDLPDARERLGGPLDPMEDGE